MVIKIINKLKALLFQILWKCINIEHLKHFCDMCWEKYIMLIKKKQKGVIKYLIRNIRVKLLKHEFIYIFIYKYYIFLWWCFCSLIVFITELYFKQRKTYWNFFIYLMWYFIRKKLHYNIIYYTPYHNYIYSIIIIFIIFN